jgi:hypothetical protein
MLHENIAREEAQLQKLARVGSLKQFKCCASMRRHTKTTLSG